VKTLKNLLLPVGTLLANIALQISGYQSPKLAAWLLAAAIFSWAWWALSHDKVILWCAWRKPVALWLAVIVGAVLGGGTGALWWVWKVKPADRSATTAASDPALSNNNPIIEAAYDVRLSGLPIIIPPRSQIEIARIKEDRTIETTTFSNSFPREWPWPTKKEIFPMEAVGFIVLSNHGNVDVFNVAYTVRVNLGAQRDPGGISTLNLSLPLCNIPSGKSVEFPVVNQSSITAVVELTGTGDIQVKGETVRRTLEFQRRALTFFDALPVLGPSLHKWKGDSILEPDQRKTNKKR
jgi:hypothetical protein